MPSKEDPIIVLNQDENTIEGLDGRGVLDYLLAEDSNYPKGEVTERDRKVAATVIQWLGSPVGQSFLSKLSKRTQR